MDQSPNRSDGSKEGLSWHEIGTAEWRIGDTSIQSIADTGEGFLVSHDRYRNYQLRVEFKPSVEVNSGVFVHCQTPDQVDPFVCHEINIWDKHPRQEFRTGAIVTKFSPPLVKEDTVGKWNLFEITLPANGAIEVALNGVVTAKLDASDLKQGHIAFQQAEGGQIEFRNLQLLDLR